MSDADLAADFVRRFLFEDLDIRGALVRVGPAWREMQAGRGYPESVRRLLGETVAVTLLIAVNLKQPGRFTLQLQGHGPVSLMVLDCTRELAFRGMAKFDSPEAEGDLGRLLGDGRLVMTLQHDVTARPYQSLVPLAGNTVAAVFEHYLAQSEQQPARLWLFAAPESATGLFLQRLPGSEARDPDGWARVTHLAATITAAELENLPAAQLLMRIFPEETLRLFKPMPVRHDCPEDWEKVRRMLRSLGREEVDSILAERGEVVVHDDICNREYRLSPADVAVLFDAGSPDNAAA
jgi:molecular chaperone Hsp33